MDCQNIILRFPPPSQNFQAKRQMQQLKVTLHEPPMKVINIGMIKILNVISNNTTVTEICRHELMAILKTTKCNICNIKECRTVLQHSLVTCCNDIKFIALKQNTIWDRHFVGMIWCHQKC